MLVTGDTMKIPARLQGETLEDYLWRLGCAKESGNVDISWREIALLLYSEGEVWKDESSWRKQFYKLKAERIRTSYDTEMKSAGHDFDDALDDENFYPYWPQSAQEAPAKQREEEVAPITQEERKMLVKIRDQRTSMNKALREASRSEELLELMREEIHRFPPNSTPATVAISDSNRALYVMLSDIHYGLTFHNGIGVYSPDIARKRVAEYAAAIQNIALEQDISECYVSLMGDLVSGNIHSLIRIENRENLVQQVVGVSELVASFLYTMSQTFDAVFVNSVSGNHSRVSLFDEDNPRAEKMDELVPWYCAAKLEGISNVIFVENEVDPTVCCFTIMGKNYFAVHGDYDKDLRVAAERISRLTGKHVDYMLAGHLHVADMRLEELGMIRNGSVCGSGDEFTAKKRLFAPPYQVCFVVDENGVRSIHPVKLQGV